jgi:hypothetical protein
MTSQPEQQRAAVTGILNDALQQLAEREAKRVTKAELEQMQAIYERQARAEHENLIRFLVTHGQEVEALDAPVYTEAQAKAAVEQAREQWATEGSNDNG